ncbi:MAG: peptidoglycan-N-acetylglucosamine deacetylase, partial [Thermoanaerobacteraceae bacterium]|nr:peptidoglycan-N-acetylglucosamine deacetylase [Thermoanaerobacteraceae bacterium]
MIWSFIRLTLFYLFFVALIPTFFGRTFHYNVIWAKKDNTPWVTITFDDGPDPVYTPELLSLLEKYDIKACFFLLADKA